MKGVTGVKGARCEGCEIIHEVNDECPDGGKVKLSKDVPSLRWHMVYKESHVRTDILPILTGLWPVPLYVMTSCKSETVVTNISSMISPAWLSTLFLVLYLSGHAFLHIHIPPLKPSTAVQYLAFSIKEENTVFDAHTRELGTFNSQLLLYVLFDS